MISTFYNKGKHTTYKVGDKIETWFSDSPDGMSTILGVRAYATTTEKTYFRYPNMFSFILTVTAPRTQKRTLEICV